MGREYEPTIGQWYEDLENEETFQVLKVDEDKETVEIQHLDGDVEEVAACQRRQQVARQARHITFQRRDRTRSDPTLSWPPV